MLRFSLRTLLLLVAVSAMAAAMVGHYFFRPDPITQVSTRAEWDSATKNGRCIVFVDCDWNFEVAAFHQPFANLAAWCQTNSDARIVMMTIDARDTKNDVWMICVELWRTNGIYRGGMRNYGGAGRVLWIEDGKIVDFAWCHDLMDSDDLENIDALKARTRAAFH